MIMLMLQKNAAEVDDVEHDEVNGEEDKDVEEGKFDDVEEEKRSRDRDPHFVGACAVQMHLDFSQKRLHKEIRR